jgi:phosphonopyruvate decarboxylase
MSEPSALTKATAICPQVFVDGLLEMGFDYFCGVPCSYFGPVLTELESRPELLYQVASVEAEAIAMAAGATLAGRNALVMLQNSGLGNCVNPISSLLAPFNIPLVMLISHRGLDAVDKKAPQHDMMGAITYDLLRLLSVPAITMPVQSEEAALEAFRQSLTGARAENRPYAVVLEGKPFAKGHGEPEMFGGRPTRLQATQALRKGFQDSTLVVASTGMVSRDLQTAGDRQRNFYMVGSMGLASAIALGLASSQEEPVVVVDGDGSCLMRLGSLPTTGRYGPENLLHVVLDNGTHSSTGGQRTAAANVDFPELALSCGYASSAQVKTLEELTSEVAGFRSGDGPRLLHFRIRSGNDPDPPRVERSLPQVKSDFMKACQS